jgi:hypothetical protein
VTLWTHKIRSLHRNDFIMAAKIGHQNFRPPPELCCLLSRGPPCLH